MRIKQGNRWVRPSLKTSKKEVLEKLSNWLGEVETSYSLATNHQHPLNEDRTPEQMEKEVKDEYLKERIAFFKSLIQVANEFTYQEEN